MSKDSQMKLNKIIVWLLINFGLCLFPILLAYFLTDATYKVIISSFISYSYTLLIVSIYLFDNYLSTTLEGEVFSASKKAVSWFFIFIFFSIFITYQVPTKLDNFTSCFTQRFILFFLILLITLALSLMLNWPLMKKTITEEGKNLKALLSDLDQIEQKSDDRINQLETEEIE